MIKNEKWTHAPSKVLYGHTPKAAGSYTIEYFREVLRYPVVESRNTCANGAWCDFTLDQVRDAVDAPQAFLCTHTLAHGWSDLVHLVPQAPKDQIVATLRLFRAHGWFAFTFVRHPGELLTSFYHYILDSHRRGWHDAVALHAAAVEIPLDTFLAAHCHREILPSYWREYDYAAEASDASFRAFYSRYFHHRFVPDSVSRHASGSRGYAHYCATGAISPQTQARIEASRNMEIYREIVDAQDSHVP